MVKLGVGRGDLLWGVGAQLFQFGAAVLILPFVLHKLSAPEMAVWYLYVALMGMVSLLDFGFSSTTALNVSYIFAGATHLSQEGIAPQSIAEVPDYGLLSSLIATIRKIYRFIALAAMVCLICAGTPYLFHVVGKSVSPLALWGSWSLIIVSTTLNLYYGYYNPLLSGSGKITAFRKITVVSRVAYIAVALVLLHLDFGLVGVAGANLVVVVITRILSYRTFFNPELRSAMSGAPLRREDLFPVLWHNARKNGVVALGAFLVQRSSLFVVAPFLALHETACLGLGTQLIGFMGGLATTFFYTLAPSLNGYRLRRDREGLLDNFAFGWVSLLGFFVVLSLPLVVLGEPLLGMLRSQTQLPSRLLLCWMLLTALLEANHGIAAGLITTRNMVPYTLPAIVSGIVIVIGTYLVLAYTEARLYGVVGVQFIVQLAYNNWKWPREMMRDLDTDYVDLFRRGVNMLKRRFLGCTR